MIKIIAINKNNKSTFDLLTAEYLQKINLYQKTELIILDPYSNPDDNTVRKLESEKLLKYFTPNNFVILLDERGNSISSPDLAQKINLIHNNSKDIIFIIGGAYGVTDEVRLKSNQVYSFSKMVFPHKLALIMILEQIYRAININRGSKYHHE